jgi:tetratricopeptide (TPR) repeat protein
MPRLRSTIASAFLLFAIAGVTPARSDDAATCRTWTGQEALAACTRMITSNTLRGADLAQAYVWRGITRGRNTDDWDAAIADYNEAIGLGSKDAGAYAGRAAMNIRKGDIDRALPDLNQAVAIDPKHTGARGVFGYYYLKKGDYGRALTEVNESIRLSPRYLYAFSTRGEIYEAKGEFNNALTDFRTALSLDPEKKQRGGREAEDSIRRIEGKLFALAGADWTTCQRAPNLEDGIAACTRLISAKKLGDADLARAYALRGVGVGRYRGDFDLAIADYDEALRLDPKIVTAYSGRGGIYVRKGRFDLARRDLDEGLKLEPNNSGVHNALGNYYLAMGDYGSAIAEYNTAIRISPQYLYPYRSRAEAYEARGDFAAALADYRVALSLDPSKQQIGGKDAAEGIARVEQRLAATADKSKVAAVAPKATEPKASPAAPKVAALGRRVALVIGNSKYRYANPLPNPANDAADISQVLRKLGFDVIEGRDLDRRGMEDRIRAFGRKLEAGADLALLFYAGHGMQVGGRNYLIPVDAKLERSGDLTLDTIELGQILAQMEAEKRVNLVFLDACRDNPLARSFARSLGTRSASVGSGLAPVQSAIGTLIAYATQPDNVALDGDGRNSPFTTALLKYIATPKLEIGSIMKRVRADVIATTREKQVPWDHSSLVGDVILVP